MQVAVLGYGLQGQSAAEYWHNQGHEITICDENESTIVPVWAKAMLGEKYLEDLNNYDLIIRSPGIHPNKLIGSVSKNKITTTTNEFFKVCPSKNIIGVTGTKGKGTTSTLISKILEEAGYRVHLGGNIGIDPLQLLKDNIQAEDWVILELSNFQLIDLNYSPGIAVCVMVVPEHLDWHETVEEYYDSKTSICRYQRKDDLVIYNGNYQASQYIANFSQGSKKRYDVPLKDIKPKSTEAAYVHDRDIYYKNKLVCSVDEVALLGRHNLENVCAAISATWDILNGDTNPITKAIKEFSGMEHRLEFVQEINGVKYYNDSFASTPEATIAAIKSFSEPKVLILGGSDKGISLDPVFNEVLNSNVRHVIAIGNMAEVVKEGLEKRNYSSISVIQTNMKDIVEEAKQVAKAGDIVLLSTACASFGMFANYKDRGNQFKKTVLAQ